MPEEGVIACGYWSHTLVMSSKNKSPKEQTSMQQASDEEWSMTHGMQRHSICLTNLATLSIQTTLESEARKVG